MSLVDYYNDMNNEQKSEFCKQSIIPEAALLELEDFDAFYEKKIALLTVRIRQLLEQGGSNDSRIK